jgi:hypothetical protein
LGLGTGEKCWQFGFVEEKRLTREIAGSPLYQREDRLIVLIHTRSICYTL